MTTQTRIKVSRDELVARLRARDGNVCRYPDCRERLDFNVKSGPLEVTIDHWMPQYWCKANGWTPDEIWAVDNLRLMHKKCNAKKGDRVPFEDGTLPARPSKTFRYRRDKRATRSDMAHLTGRLVWATKSRWCSGNTNDSKPFNVRSIRTRGAGVKVNRQAATFGA